MPGENLNKTEYKSTDIGSKSLEELNIEQAKERIKSLEVIISQLSKQLSKAFGWAGILSSVLFTLFLRGEYKDGIKQDKIWVKLEHLTLATKRLAEYNVETYEYLSKKETQAEYDELVKHIDSELHFLMFEVDGK